MIRNSYGNMQYIRLRRSASIACCSIFFFMGACQDLTGNPPLPAGIQSPDVYNTPQGALQQAKGAIRLARVAFPVAIQYGGILTDELTTAAARFAAEREGRVDMRFSVDITIGSPYALLQDARGHARLARNALVVHAPDEFSDFHSLMYALEGYAEILLADLYCSGVPLSTLDFPVGFTYARSSSNLDVYAHAAALFDTALAHAVENDSIDALVRVGLGRALIGLGLFDSAARIVASVPSTAMFRMKRQYKKTDAFIGGFTVADREGQNGLPYLSSGDPRTHSTVVTPTGGAGNIAYTAFVPTKYLNAQANDSTFMLLASGVEARLIEAEADLALGGTDWLILLNALRTNGTMTITHRTDVPGTSPGPAGYPDTSWASGYGIGLLAPSVVSDNKPACPANIPCTDTVWYRGLRPLTDPGVGLPAEIGKTARVDLLFKERAFWLLLSGHRQGDLRRLVRQYGRDQNVVYPTGVYADLQGLYGDAIALPIPNDEFRNPHYKGCLNNGA